MTFEQKLAKGMMSKNPECPKCGKEMTLLKIIKPYKTKNGNIRFKNLMTHVCPCSEKEIFG